MTDRRSPADDERDQSRPCTRGAHVDCPHLNGVGGGFNPRRLRFEFGDQLCRCSCHASCPVQYEANRMTVAKNVWHASCTCAGAEVVRPRLADAGGEGRGFAESVAERRRRRSADREALEATRARANGRSREEIREIYLAERNARNLTRPADPVLDAVVEHIVTGSPLPAIQALLQTGKEIYDDASHPRGRHAKGRAE